MEHLRPEWLQLDIQPTEVHLCINGLIRIFTSEDTAYWIYPEKFKMFNHIIKWTNDTYECWFSPSEEDLDLLHEAGITQISSPYPNKETINSFWRLEMADYDREMDNYEQTGEL